MKQRRILEILYATKVMLKLKKTFYQILVGPTMLYETECWATNNQCKNTKSVVNVNLLHLMCGRPRQNKINNDNVRERVKVAPITTKKKKNS